MRRTLMTAFICSAMGALPAAAIIEEASMRQGDVLQQMRAASALQCQRACDDDADCRSWTYKLPGVLERYGVCVLNQDVGRSVSSPCCESGLNASLLAGPQRTRTAPPPIMQSPRPPTQAAVATPAPLPAAALPSMPPAIPPALDQPAPVSPIPASPEPPQPAAAPAPMPRPASPFPPQGEAEALLVSQAETAATTAPFFVGAMPPPLSFQEQGPQEQGAVPLYPPVPTALPAPAPAPMSIPEAAPAEAYGSEPAFPNTAPRRVAPAPLVTPPVFTGQAQSYSITREYDAAPLREQSPEQ